MPEASFRGSPARWAQLRRAVSSCPRCSHLNARQQAASMLTSSTFTEAGSFSRVFMSSGERVRLSRGSGPACVHPHCQANALRRGSSRHPAPSGEGGVTTDQCPPTLASAGLREGMSEGRPGPPLPLGPR